MARPRKSEGSDRPSRPPATTPEGREQQLISLAVDETERLIRSGQATSQLLTHYLKLGSTRERLEQERLRGENELLKAKVESLATAANIEQLYDRAIKAMRSYQGHPDEEVFDDQVLQ